MCVTISEIAKDFRDLLLVNPKIKEQWLSQRGEKFEQTITLEQFVEQKYIKAFYRELDT